MPVQADLHGSRPISSHSTLLCQASTENRRAPSLHSTTIYLTGRARSGSWSEMGLDRVQLHAIWLAHVRHHVGRPEIIVSLVLQMDGINEDFAPWALLNIDQAQIHQLSGVLRQPFTTLLEENVCVLATFDLTDSFVVLHKVKKQAGARI
eukprot:CAMPEP_0171094772 /NCGR_PEP_ID=MMETSP0766_2-20121228/42325_1 /TAXON_ID=439317 /ORGANISM="Gambierdiscus australes, Strain CAWD 149" /LENGTH=149 /DNA_ID=CAMNT_0011553485 /DNA_START=172 /DNA_END=622 /DNA_ORIENTATION=-